jgi:hypothetical protein
MDNEKSVLDALALKGLNAIFNRSGYYYGYHNRNKMKSDMLALMSSESLHPYFDTLKDEASLTAISTVLSEQETFSEYWRDRFLELSELDNIRGSVHSLLRDDAKHIQFGISLNDSLDDYALFQILHERAASYAYIPKVYMDSVNSLCESNSLAFKIFADTELFGRTKSSLKPAFRGFLYSKYISSGFLTEKTARKIRSESSYEASLKGVQALINSEDKYDNHNDLLLKFSDSRHEEVLAELARSLPIWLLSSLLGTESHYVKGIIEHRMNEQ